MISEPHHWPEKLRKLKIEGFAWREWKTYFTGVGKPLLVGGVLCSAPFVPISFYITRAIVARHQRKKREQALASGVPKSTRLSDYSYRSLNRTETCGFESRKQAGPDAPTAALNATATIIAPG